MEDDKDPIEQDEEANEQPDEKSDELSAEGAAAQADVMLESARESRVKETNSLRNKLLMALVAIVLFVVGAVLLFGGGSDDAADSSTTNEESSKQSNEAEPEAQAEETLGQIVYAHQTVDGTPFSVFSRPVDGGDRTDLDIDLGRGSFLRSATDGSSYAVVNQTNEVYYGSGTTPPELLYSASENIAGILIDESAGSILILERPELFGATITSTVRVIPTDGSAPSEFLVDETDGSSVLFIESWDGENELLFARRSCTQCDGYDPNLISIDASGTESDVYTPGTAFNVSSGYVFSADRSKALFIEATEYSQAEQDQLGISGGLGGPNTAPFTMYELDLASGDASEIVTFGSAEDVGEDGFFAVPLAYYASTGSRAYAYQQQLHVQNNGGNFDNFFETGQGDIRAIYAIDDNELLVGAESGDGQLLSYFNIETQEGAIVMETSQSTRILTVTQ